MNFPNRTEGERRRQTLRENKDLFVKDQKKLMLSEDHEHAILSAVLLANNRPGACSRKHSKSIDVQQKYSNITSNLKKKPNKQTNK